MIKDYRKRAEELILSLGITGEIRIAGEIERLAEAFKQIAQEARQEENEACAKILIKQAGDNNSKAMNCPNKNLREIYLDHANVAKEIAKAIRSRMIVPEPMEEK